MNRLRINSVALAASMLLGSSASAANIVWVTSHETGPSAAAVTAGFTQAPDIGYTNMLAGAGHSVTRFLVPAAAANVALSPAQLAVLNAADLVILSRSCNSGSFQEAAETLSWNTSITVPMIVNSGYLVRPNRMAYHTADTPIPDITAATRFVAPNPGHPIFNGITLNGSNETGEILNVVTAPIAGNPVQRGTSILNNAIIAGGTVIASITSDGTVAPNATVIAEFPTATPTGNAGETLSSKRLTFFTGSREVDGGNSETAGIMDLSATGQQIYLNAVCHMVGGCTVLVPGDTDGDGVVELADDFNPIRDNFRKTGKSRAQGDLTGGGGVDFNDFRQWKGAYVAGGGSLADIDFNFISSVPEPSAAMLAVLGLLGLVPLCRRR